MKKKAILAKKLIEELTAYTQARASSKHELCVLHLGRAHILSQYKWFHHFYVHIVMFEYAWSRKDYKELVGQVIRLFATVPGHLFGKIPWGNTGWSSVPLTKKITLPDDMKNLF